MNKNKSIIIFDWDDTLFPTSWIIKQNIDIQESKYMFTYLDKIIYELINKALQHSFVIIVTNASIKWIYNTLSVLPYSNDLIKNYIPIISAKELYQDKYPKDIYMWKQSVFKVYDDFYNIISIGDADYEYKALINMDNNNKLLKAIKLLSLPEYELLLDQLTVLDNMLINIIYANNNIDYKFKIGNVC